jgi:hypothetical protein
MITICNAHHEHCFGKIINGKKDGVNGETGNHAETGQCVPKWNDVSIGPVLTGNCVSTGHVETGHDVSIGNCVSTGPVETGQCPVSTKITATNTTNVTINATNVPTNPITYQKTPGELQFRNQGKDTVSSIIDGLVPE